jgi:hypothetical protein
MLRSRKYEKYRHREGTKDTKVSDYCSELRALRAFVVKAPIRLLAQIDYNSPAHAAFENLVDLDI